MYRIVLTKRAEKSLTALPEDVQSRCGGEGDEVQGEHEVVVGAAFVPSNCHRVRISSLLIYIPGRRRPSGRLLHESIRKV